jgi:hypothetical protein
MNIITNSRQDTKYLEYSIKIYDEDHSSFLTRELPIPNLHTNMKQGYSVTYFLKGYNGTNKVNDFYLDTQNRIMTSLKGLEFELIEHPILMTNTRKYFEKIYEFKDFSHLDKSRTQKFIDYSKEVRTLDKDTLFEVVRQDSYEMKRNGTLSLQRVFDLCDYYNKKLHINKSHSDIRSKSRNIFEWTRDNYNVGSKDRKERNRIYYLQNRKDDTMTKKEHLEKIASDKRLKTQSKIFESVKILKEQSQKITLQTICKLTKLNKNTLTRYKDFINSIK